MLKNNFEKFIFKTIYEDNTNLPVLETPDENQERVFLHPWVIYLMV